MASSFDVSLVCRLYSITPHQLFSFFLFLFSSQFSHCQIKPCSFFPPSTLCLSKHPHTLSFFSLFSQPGTLEPLFSFPLRKHLSLGVGDLKSSKKQYAPPSSIFAEAGGAGVTLAVSLRRKARRENGGWNYK